MLRPTSCLSTDGAGGRDRARNGEGGRRRGRRAAKSAPSRRAGGSGGCVTTAAESKATTPYKLSANGGANGGALGRRATRWDSGWDSSGLLSRPAGEGWPSVRLRAGAGDDAMWPAAATGWAGDVDTWAVCFLGGASSRRKAGRRFGAGWEEPQMMKRLLGPSVQRFTNGAAEGGFAALARKTGPGRRSSVHHASPQMPPRRHLLRVAGGSCSCGELGPINEVVWGQEHWDSQPLAPSHHGLRIARSTSWRQLWRADPTHCGNTWYCVSEIDLYA